MTARAERQDKRFPIFFNDNLVRRLLLPPRRLTGPFVRRGQRVADVGCGPGFHTLELAGLVGPEGRVYAVDPDEAAIRALERKADERGVRNIETHAASAVDLGFIADGSVDFVLAHGLLCSMAPQHHSLAAREIGRILKPDGLAYLSVARGPWSYVGEAEWEEILAGYRVERRGDGFPWIAHRWAVVRPKRGSEKGRGTSLQLTANAS
jgi:ubiquinone/menaquinone biosynthesis C-methylase UbiE